MSDVRSTASGSVFGHASDDWRGESAMTYRSEPHGLSTGWLMVGMAAVALGAWAAYHFGPDFRRYIKMERM